MRSRCYPSDTTNAEWALLELLLPDTGCKWRALPADYPPWRTVWGFRARWASAGIVGQIRDHLAGRIRRDMGKGPRAVATVIDSQSVKAAETVSERTDG